MIFNKKKAIVFSLMCCVLAAGCSSNATTGVGQESATEPDQPVKPSEPITLQVFQAGGSISDTEFKDLIQDPVKKKFPHITMELVREKEGTMREQLIAAGTFPDMIYTSTLTINSFLDLQLMTDLNESITKNKLDLNPYVKRAIDEIKVFGDKGQMYALPFAINFGVTYYNKDIFDLAGMPYPKDGITWEELLDTAKQIAAKQPTFKALGTSGITRDNVSLGLGFVDPKTETAILNKEGWAWLFNFHNELSKLPDNRQAKAGRDGFVNEKTMAMYTSYTARIGELEEAEKAGKPVNWDMATFPVRKDATVQGMETEAHTLSISSTAKHPEEAFQVIQFLTTSEEVQTLVAKKARVSSLKDEQYTKAFGQDVQTLKGKNVQAIFKNKYAPNAAPTKYDAIASKAVSTALNKVTKEGVDINTALRQAEEETNKGIQQMKSQ